MTKQDFTVGRRYVSDVGFVVLCRSLTCECPHSVLMEVLYRPDGSPSDPELIPGKVVPWGVSRIDCELPIPKWHVRLRQWVYSLFN